MANAFPLQTDKLADNLQSRLTELANMKMAQKLLNEKIKDTNAQYQNEEAKAAKAQISAMALKYADFLAEAARLNLPWEYVDEVHKQLAPQGVIPPEQFIDRQSYEVRRLGSKSRHTPEGTERLQKTQSLINNPEQYVRNPETGEIENAPSNIGNDEAGDYASPDTIQTPTYPVSAEQSQYGRTYFQKMGSPDSTAWNKAREDVWKKQKTMAGLKNAGKIDNGLTSSYNTTSRELNSLAKQLDQSIIGGLGDFKTFDDVKSAFSGDKRFVANMKSYQRYFNLLKREDILGDAVARKYNIKLPHGAYIDPETGEVTENTNSAVGQVQTDIQKEQGVEQNAIYEKTPPRGRGIGSKIVDIVDIKTKYPETYRKLKKYYSDKEIIKYFQDKGVRK